MEMEWSLFIPAFYKTDDPGLKERLRNRFIEYFNDMTNYRDEMKELLAQIEDTGEEEVSIRLNDTLDEH
jgi:hypothetical protein